jgi:uncharacterized membrane protein
MDIRLHEFHAMLVHFPLTLLPLAVGADVVGRLTDSDRMRSVARTTTPVATMALATAGKAGLIAEQAVRAEEGEPQMKLARHRNLNLLLLGTAVGMSAYRMGRQRPSTAYLATGVGALAVMGYSAYLGGNITYHHGVGVEASGGVNRERSPHFRFSKIGRFAGAAIANLRDEFKYLARLFSPSNARLPTTEDFGEALEEVDQPGEISPVVDRP